MSEQSLEQILQETDDSDDFIQSLGVNLHSVVPEIQEKDEEVQRRKIENLNFVELVRKMKPSSSQQTVLLPKPLPGVSQILSSPKSINEVGFPTCMHCNTKWITIGTAHGLVLIFDISQHIKQTFGATNMSSEKCDPVTALDLAKDIDWIGKEV